MASDGMLRLRANRNREALLDDAARMNIGVEECMGSSQRQDVRCARPDFVAGSVQHHTVDA